MSAHDEPSDDDTAHIREHFGEQDFLPEGGFVLRQGQHLPPLVWEHPEQVAAVIDNPAIPTRWFDEDLTEVDVAQRPGRYYVYGEAPAPDGPVLRRAMTCCCVGEGEDLALLAEKLMPDIHRASDPGLKRARMDSTVDHWRTSEEGAIALAALMEADAKSGPVRKGQWIMENASRHVQLKRRLMGLDSVPPVKVAARPLEGPPAPVLRRGTLEQAGITAELVKELESRFDAWYASAREPTAVVIARNGTIALARAYGELDGQPVTVNTPMLLHSAMKPLMGLQLAMYVDRGIVQLDEPVGNYLPDFSSEEDRRLTFRAGHVHVSGIHFPWDLAFSRLFYFRTWQEALISHCPREWVPGDRHRYGIVGIILAVRALELLSGKNYWDAMEGELFEPLGIRDMLPGGTGFSAEDMARIGVLLDNHGKYGEQELISEETYRSILPTSLTPYFPDVDLEYGIGFQTKEGHLGPGSYGHGGGGGSQIIVDPEKHLVFAMVRNDRGKDFRMHMEGVLALLNAWIGN